MATKSPATNSDAAADQAAAPTPGIPALVVSSRSPMGSFRRAGREWTRESITLPLSELTDDQVKALRNEPMLVVSDTVIAPATATDLTGDQAESGATA
jgi:hypothetical protein